jgi:hypothetical protein
VAGEMFSSSRVIWIILAVIILIIIVAFILMNGS